MSTYNVHDYRAGDTMILDITMRDESKAPVDLTGATVTWAVALVTRGKVGSAIVTKTVGDGIIISAPTTGVIRVTLSAGDLPDAGEYYHELEVTLASLESYTALSGKIVAKKALIPN